MSELLVDFITSLTATHRERPARPWGLEGPSTSLGSASSPRPPTSWERTPTA